MQVMPFFNRVGFQLPERKGIADFLQEVTSPKDQGELTRHPASKRGSPTDRRGTFAGLVHMRNVTLF